MIIDVKHAAVQENSGREQAPGAADGQARRRKQSFFRMMISVMQASFGVQTDANRQRDFEQGSITGFVVAALIFTVLFVVSLLVLVQLVLP